VHLLVTLFTYEKNFSFSFLRNSPQWARASSFLRFLDHTQRRTSQQDSSGRVISPSQSPLPHNTQHSQEKDFHAPGGIRTHIPNKRAATDLRLRPRGHWYRRMRLMLGVYNVKSGIACYLPRAVLADIFFSCFPV